MVEDIVELSIDGNLVDMSQIGSISFTDNAGNTSDKIEVKIAPNFPRPRPFAEVTLFFKTLKDGVVAVSYTHLFTKKKDHNTTKIPHSVELLA